MGTNRNGCANGCVWLAAWAVLATVPSTLGQTAPLGTRFVPTGVDSGFVENGGPTPAVIFSTTITVPDATWLRLQYEAVELAGDIHAGTGSYLLVTSLEDGAFQFQNALHVEQWQKTSAYFNGDAVLIQLVAYPGTGPNRLAISQTMADDGTTPESICGPTDDRLLSGDVRAARALPIGCTAWLLEDCNHCFGTAGHCTSSLSTIQFNVPLSDANGGLRHPGPEDQYSVDASSIQFVNGGVGNDWGYFGCFRNSTTNLTAYEAQGAAFKVAPPPPAQQQDIRITGYGTMSVPRTWSQVQKTHVGPFFSFIGTTLRYQTDTTGGNSGSPVILDSTQEAIGVHTHGGCGNPIGSTSNAGTGSNHSSWQAALAAPRGVCKCDGLYVSPSGGLDPWGNPGGPFAPNFIDCTLKNGGTAAFDYEVTKTQAWLSLTNATGTLPPGGEVTVRVSLNAGANALPLGLYRDTVKFTNLTAHTGDTTRPVRLHVGTLRKITGRDMETDPGWTPQGQWAWGTPTGGGGEHGPKDPTSGYTGTNVYGYNLSGDYANGIPEEHLTTGAINCTGLSDVTLRFRRWLGVQPPAYDHAYVRVSTDGTTFSTVWQNKIEIADATWTLQQISLADYADNQPAVYLRWTMGKTDTEWRYCGWNLDDVDILALGRLGDLNCDGAVNNFDIDPFVLALSDPAGYAKQYPNCDRMLADCNGDGVVNNFDIDPFVKLLTP